MYEPRNMRAEWSQEARADLLAMWSKYDMWIEKISNPDYKFHKFDLTIFEKLGYPSITIEELQSGSIPPEIAEGRISTKEDSQTG